MHDRTLLLKSDSLTPEEKQALVPIPKKELARMDMTIDTRKYNTQAGQVISVEDVDSGLIKSYYLDPKKRELKKKLWLKRNASWVAKEEKKEKEAAKKKTKGQITTNPEPETISDLTEDDMPPPDQVLTRSMSSTLGKRQRPFQAPDLQDMDTRQAPKKKGLLSFLTK